MFERQLGLRENPFLAGHHPKFVYPSREHQEALAHLRYGIQNREPFVLITGEVGTGKTTAVYDALGEWGSRAVVALITNSALTRSELLEEICLRFGVAAPGPLSKPQALVQLERLLSAVSARGELAILLLDEAQNLDRELLEEIRLLSNLEVQGEKLLQIFLVGQPELEAKLAQPELRQLRQRIGIHYRILPLNSTETANYVHHRVAVAGGNAHEMFPPETCMEIFRITNGIPREINIVAGQALLNAFVEDSRAVSADHVRSVEREIEFQSVLRDHSQLGRAAAAPPATSPPARPEEVAPPAPRMTPPEPGPAPVALRPAPVDDPNAHILPSWFDEVVERRRREDQESASAAPPPPPAYAEVPPTYAQAPPAFTPAYEEPAPLPVEPRPPTEAAPVETIRVFDDARAPVEIPSGPTPIDFLTHRLREKLTEAEAPKPKRSGLGWLIAATLVAAVAVGGFMVMRSGWTLQRQDPAPTPAAPTTTPSTKPATVPPAQASVPVPSPGGSTAQNPPGAQPGSTPTPAGATATSTPAVKPPVAPATKSPAPIVTASRPTPAPAAATTGTGTTAAAKPVPPRPAAPKPAAASGAFGIAVGTYLDEERAIAERTSLTESTRLPAQVVTIAEDSVSMYRVVMGAFENRLSAERMASDLIRRGLVNEARVVPVARATPPRP